MDKLDLLDRLHRVAVAADKSACEAARAVRCRWSARNGWEGMAGARRRLCAEVAASAWELRMSAARAYEFESWRR